jgi:hypothetical protein
MVGICVEEENVCFEPEGKTASGNWLGNNANLKYFFNINNKQQSGFAHLKSPEH